MTAPDPLEPTTQPPCAGLLEPMLTDAVIAPLTEEDDTFEDVDPEEGHEDNPATSQWVMHKNSPRERPRYDALIPTKSLRLNIEVSSRWLFD